LSEKLTTFAQKILTWFSLNRRDFPWRRETDPYKILVVEKLLQQTTYGHVLKVYHEFFQKFPNLQSLANAEVSEIENTIRRLGFHRQRARQLKEIARTIMDEFSGIIPSNKDDLLNLKGVGDYITNAVLCFAFGMDTAIVDMNVRRVVGRVFGWKEVNDKEIAERLLKVIPTGRAKELNWALIDFSAIICSRKPKCKICFLKDICEEQRQPSRNQICNPP
jgi:A/G-specific adenine glycosylase